MALKLKYTDEHGILHINMSPTSSPKEPNGNQEPEPKVDITDPKFDTINSRFGQYDLFGGKYDGGDSPRSLFRSRYNSIEEELANTPYAFATERTLRLNNNPLVDITIKSRAFTDEASPSKDIEDDRFFNRKIGYDDSLFGPQLDFLKRSSDEDETPAFTVTQLIHAQDRYFDLSGQSSKIDDNRNSVVKSTISVRSAPGSGKKERAVKIVDSRTEIEHGAFKVLSTEGAESVRNEPSPAALPVVPISKRKRESSFAILSETPVASRPSSPRSLPIERTGRVSPFKGRGFREETSRHTTPKTSAANSRAPSPSRRRTNSLSKIDKMAHVATLPPPVHTISRPHSPRNFLKENIEEIRELSELNREKHEAELERQRIEEEEALLKEMGLLNKNGKSDSIKSLVASRNASRTASRSNSPSKINLRSRSNSPSAILHFEKIPADSKEFINTDVSSKPVTHNSRLRSVSKSQPQSNNVSPKHSKIPKRQSSVSPPRIGIKRDVSNSRKPMENNLNRSQRFMSNSTSSIHETIKIGSQVHDKRAMSKSTQHLSLSPAVKGKPPISPGRGGPPPSNRAINAKRLSPIVGTPNKSPVEDSKPGSARTTQRPAATARKPVKTAGNTPATSRLNSRQPSRAVSRDQSPDKRKTLNKPSTTAKSTKTLTSKPVNRSVSVKTPQKPIVASKPETKKPMNRTNSMKSLVRTPSTRTLNEKPPLVKKGSKKEIPVKAQSTSKINELGTKKDDDDKKTNRASAKKEGKINKENAKTSIDSGTNMDEVTKQDNETQYDKITNEKGEIVLLTKKSIISMTTAAITAQPLEVVTTVTNQLPAALEKAREKGIFERLNSKDSIAGKEDIKENKEEKKEPVKTTVKKTTETKEKHEEKEKKETITKPDKPTMEKKASELITSSTVFIDDNVKLKPLQPPYNNPQVERVKQKIDDILRSPEVSIEKILADTKIKEAKKALKEETEKIKEDAAAAKEVAKKVEEIKEDTVKASVKEIEKTTEEIRSEASKIVDSIITPVEEPKPVVKPKEEVKKIIEPIVTVVNEKTNGPSKELEKMTETLVKGDPEVEVQSSNMSTPAADKMAVENKMAENGSDKSTHSNGGFPQSTSTTPKPPARAHRKESKEETPPDEEQGLEPKKPNICQRLMGKCKKCCACCGKPEPDEDMEQMQESEEKRGVMSRLNCCRKKDKDTISDIERAAGKASTIEFESETKRKRKVRDILCGCCGRRRRVSDVSAAAAGDGTVGGGGCCGRGRPAVDRRDSILSDEPPTLCCNNRLCNWFRGACRRTPEPSSRRPSLFSKNKSLSPTLPPEDTRPKLDPSLIEHTSVMRGAIPVLPAVLAYFCLVCNVIVPGLGTIFSGMFCLCFGIPRFGAHDGAKHRIGSFVINLLVGAGQVFTVLFCLVGWGWSIWWGVILVKISRKYRKLKAEAKAEEVEAAPPVTSNNHTRA